MEASNRKTQPDHESDDSVEQMMQTVGSQLYQLKQVEYWKQKVSTLTDILTQCSAWN